MLILLCPKFNFEMQLMLGFEMVNSIAIVRLIHLHTSKRMMRLRKLKNMKRHILYLAGLLKITGKEQLIWVAYLYPCLL